MTDGHLEPAPHNPWRTLERGVAFADTRLRVRVDRVVQPDGREGTYTLVEIPFPVVAIVPLEDDGRVHLVRQWRYPWGCSSWEVPAGHAEPDEEPLAAARRELAEEVGLQADAWQPLGPIQTSAVISARFTLYLARGLRPVAGSSRDGSEEDLVTRAVPLREALGAIEDGRIVHAVSAVALLRVARMLGV